MGVWRSHFNHFSQPASTMPLHPPTHTHIHAHPHTSTHIHTHPHTSTHIHTHPHTSTHIFSHMRELMWFKVGARLYGVLTRACNSIAGPPHEHFFFFSFFFRRQVRDGGCARDQLVVARRVLVEYVTNAAFLPYTPRRTTSDDLLGGRGRPLSAPLTISWGHPTLPTTTPPPLQAPTITITHHHHITTTRHPPPATDGMHSNRISHHMLTRVGPPAPTARLLAPATFLPSAIPARPRPRVAFPAVLADTRSMIAVPLDWAKGVLDLGLISTISRVCSASCRPHKRRVP